MEDDILQVIEEEISNNPSIEEMKTVLEERGYSQSSIDDALLKVSHKFTHNPQKKIRRNVRLFTSKELVDRVGFGFATHQFVNILFYHTILLAGFGSFAIFLVGFLNGIKSLLSALISSVIQEYQKIQRLSKKFIALGGVLFGFSFLFMALARATSSVLLFAIALLVASVGVVTYGDLYNELLKENLKKERMTAFLARISQYGIILTAIALLMSGYLMETIPLTGKVFTISLLGKVMTFRLYGYLISFEITALAFVISGYIVSRIHQKPLESHTPLYGFFHAYYDRILRHLRLFFSNKFIVLLMLASMISGIIQVLGNSYYGIFIYERFQNVAFGGFINVAIIYAFSIVVSLFGPWFARLMHRSIGYSPMLVFGTLLIGMMPFFSAWQPNIYAVGVATTLSIIGSAIVGVAHGFLARKLLHEHERKLYFSSLSIIITIPYLILLPLGAWYAQVYGFAALFKLLVYTLIFVVVPLYIVLVTFAEKRKL